MTSAQVVETSANVITNSPSQDYTHPDDHNDKKNRVRAKSYHLNEICIIYEFNFHDSSWFSIKFCARQFIATQHCGVFRCKNVHP